MSDMVGEVVEAARPAQVPHLVSSQQPVEVLVIQEGEREA
jgi:hypothetical protein